MRSAGARAGMKSRKRGNAKSLRAGLSRRSFLSASGATLAAFGLEGTLAAGAASETTEPRAGRLIIPLNRHWLYSARRALQTAGGQALQTAGGQAPNDVQPSFSDAEFERVTLPHTNRLLPWHSFDEKSYQFVSIYRRRFTLPPEARGHRVFVDFEGAMTASTVWLNGQRAGEYRGGYTPFSFELTPYIHWDRENLMAVELDSTERGDIPPFGGQMDYLSFGGIYREVQLRCVNSPYLEDIVARTNGDMTPRPAVEVNCHIAGWGWEDTPLTLRAEVRDGDTVIAGAEQTIEAGERRTDNFERSLTIPLTNAILRWTLEDPHLYNVVVRILRKGAVVDEDRRRIGFREAKFTEHGFELNGQVVKLRGLNRHQTFPFAGGAMPARVERRDAYILRKELHCNIVRTSHYPQSRHFLDACDELGLLVLEEIPGWQYVGDAGWQDLAVDNVRRMVVRDRHHPSIVLWGVRINESRDNHDFYTRTNAAAHELDPTRQTGGIRYFQDSELLEDVFTMNDFGFPLKPPNHPRYLNTEFCGHTFVTKPNDTVERLTEHIRRHARVHNQLGSNPQYAGGIGWCAFDYNTHADFGSGDRVCYHGVCDIFRMPKPAAAFYRSQCAPSEEIVLEPAFQWPARDDWTDALKTAMVCSNCDHLKFYIGEKLVAEAEPDRATYPNLPHPPFQLDLDKEPWGDLRIEGYVAGEKVIERSFSCLGVDKQFLVEADDAELHADGADTTRVTMRVADEYGALRRYSTAAIALTLEGPARLIGENPFSLLGGCGAVWVRAGEQAGIARLTATHPVLGAKTIEVRMVVRQT